MTKIIEWADETLSPFQIDKNNLREIALASRSTEKFVVVVRLIYKHEKSRPHAANESNKITDMILDSVNKSKYSLSDWIDGINIFSAWLEKNSRQASFSSMLHYLQCCAASPDATKGNHNFQTLVSDMLDLCGYEGKA